METYTIIVLLLAATIRVATPLLLAALGALFSERAGVIDLGLEGKMLGAAFASECGLEVHMGHGLTFETVQPIAAIPEVVELNIGHFLIGEAVFLGLGPAITEMRRLMDEARGSAA